MKSKVYFIAVNEAENKEAIALKLNTLLRESNVLDCVRPDDNVAVKMHFGEEGNTGFVAAEYVRVVCEDIASRNAQATLSDTNTLYRGRRTNSDDHRAIAIEHGFSDELTNAKLVIPNDRDKSNTAEVSINQKFIKTAKVCNLFRQADCLVGIAHFKGHIMTGFGGALKNIGMGCASREGKLAQHSDVSPMVHLDNCVGCGACEKVCPVKAIVIIEKKSHIDPEKCIGCASCIAACNYHAIDVDWDAGGDVIQEKMIEYAKAVLDAKIGKTAFLNFVLKITKECDCLAKDDPRIASDVGILASVDPVSIDKASLDLVRQACGRDIFKEVHPQRNGMKQLQHAAEIGLGNLEYELIRLTTN